MKRLNLSPVLFHNYRVCGGLVGAGRRSGYRLPYPARFAPRTANPFTGRRVGDSHRRHSPEPTLIGPSCYADCGKRATSDAAGFFDQVARSAARLSRAAWPRVTSRSSSRWTRSRTKSLDVTLKSRPKPPDDPQRISLSGQVRRPPPCDRSSGRLSGSPFSCKIGERRWSGSMPGVDPLAVTDEQGQFQIVAAQEPVRRTRFGGQRAGVCQEAVCSGSQRQEHESFAIVGRRDRPRPRRRSRPAGRRSQCPKPQRHKWIAMPKHFSVPQSDRHRRRRTVSSSPTSRAATIPLCLWDHEQPRRARWDFRRRVHVGGDGSPGEAG